ncbi:MAG: hypothetical protein ACR2QK_25320 [Acidimicrobiales bacterium]
MVATALSTLLPWTTGDTGSVIGVRHDDAFLVIAASVLGIVLFRINVKPAWIAPGFAAFTQFRDIRQILDADLGVGIGLWLGLATATGAAALLIVDLVATIRAGAAVEENADS